jgi:hypothetical protein
MSDQSKRRVRVVGATIIVAALMVSASVLFASYGLVGSRTVTKTVTSASTTTNLITTTTTSTEVPASIPLHMVTFNESGDCGGVYANRWAVTMGNITISQPSNMTYPFPPFGGESDTAAGAIISKIIFTVPDGTYNYTTYAPAMLFPFSGTVDVNGSDVVVQLELEISCMAN